MNQFSNPIPFYVQDRSVKSDVTKDHEGILIMINSVQFYEIFKKAIHDYRTELKSNEELQCNFVDAWQSIENHIQNITSNPKLLGEVEYLLKELEQSNT